MSPPWDTQLERIDGSRTTLQEYEGHVLLIVNTATQCGFSSQLTGLERLWTTYRSDGLVVLGFPCAQFFQERGKNAQVADVCQVRYGVTFPLFSKIEVNGRRTHPLFGYLKRAARGFLGSTSIKWNFTKFLVDHEGQVQARYGPTTSPARIEARLRVLLERRNAERRAGSPTDPSSAA